MPLSLAGQQLGFGIEQINGQALIESDLTGRGIKVGIIDGGFLKADQHPFLKSLFEKKQIIGYRDYLDSTATAYSGSKALDDIHGTEVWGLIAGYNKEKGVQYGLATGAFFYLARTDHGGYEKRQEEKNAIKAMEWMAQEGVRIINLSLGYNYGYTNKHENYKPAQMDGKSTILTQALNRISKEYDVLIIVAAGNDGNTSWRIINSPADAEKALSVGATKYKTWDNMNYSSKGPEWLNYVKPEVACYGAAGTSFSAPIITGLAACLLEKDSTLTSQELKELIVKSCNLSRANNYIGYGVPDAKKALAMLDGEIIHNTNNEIAVHKKNYKLIIDKDTPYFTVYHKDEWKVIQKETLRTLKEKIKIHRKEKATSSTVIWKGGTLEIIWK